VQVALTCQCNCRHIHGVFNDYEIKQLKLKFKKLNTGHSLLVRDSNQHVEDIKALSDNMRSIVDVIDLMAEYSLELLMVKTGKQLDEFKSRVTVLANAVDQLHHKK
jgi:hypothetical protein